jgi:hypothetical protein
MSKSDNLGNTEKRPRLSVGEEVIEAAPEPSPSVSDAASGPAQTSAQLWLDRAKTSSIALVAGLVGAVLATSLDLADKIFKITDRLAWTRSEQIVLAKDSAKSRFSEGLIRAAWKRIFLAEIFARRVSDAASSSLYYSHSGAEIDDAWKAYIVTLTEWNSDLMINIVGLQEYYDAFKSTDFEGQIQGQFIILDGLLRELRLSTFVKSILSGKSDVTDNDRRELKPVLEAIFDRISDQRKTLYFFVRCFSSEDKSQRLQSCHLPGFLSGDADRDPTLR